MHSSDGAKDRGDQIPRLAPGWHPEDVALTPAEGFLISRMDGQTPWEMLRQIGGIEPEQVDDYIERWIESGAVEFVKPKAAAPPEKPDPTPLNVEAEIDTSLDIGEPLQRRILDYELRIDGSYHDLLGIERGSDSQTVKRAYFALSKKFHPDRYFRRNIGDYAERLDRIFRKGAEAYELCVLRIDFFRSITRPFHGPGLPYVVDPKTVLFSEKKLAVGNHWMRPTVPTSVWNLK